jgi:hypothetical protein
MCVGTVGTGRINIDCPGGTAAAAAGRADHIFGSCETEEWWRYVEYGHVFGLFCLFLHSFFVFFVLIMVEEEEGARTERWNKVIRGRC